MLMQAEMHLPQQPQTYLSCSCVWVPFPSATAQQLAGLIAMLRLHPAILVCHAPCRNQVAINKALMCMFPPIRASLLSLDV